MCSYLVWCDGTLLLIYWKHFKREIIVIFFILFYYFFKADDGEDFMNLYLKNIESQTKSLIEEGGVGEIDAREQSALVAIKIAIDRLVKDLPFHEESMQLLKVLSYFSERDLPRELIASCAETVSSTDGRVRFCITPHNA